MGSLSGEDDQFFDSREDIISVSDSGSDCLENSDSDVAVLDALPRELGYDVWVRNPSSIHERRGKFFRWMGLSGEQLEKEDVGDGCCDEIEVDTDRLRDNGEAVLRSSSFNDGLSTCGSYVSRCSSDDIVFDGVTEENSVLRIKNLDNGTEFVVDEVEQDGVVGMIREVGSNRLMTAEEFESRLGLSPLVQRVMRREVGNDRGQLKLARKKVKRGWLRKLGSAACIVDRQVDGGGIVSSYSFPISRSKIQKVKVKIHRKRSKELSALYMGQEMQAHDGWILTMKFSPDGRYLASGGVDGIVRVWLVESLRSDDLSVDIDPSCVYFTTNSLSKCVPVCVDKEKKGQVKGVKKTSDSACVIFPQNVFHIVQTPIHEFHGHCGEVLDLAWSRNKRLLSSSVDKTVRLWQVGSNQCLKVFSHNNYVSCVHFNPVDDNHFVSGSIDGKVRMWAIPGCQVVDWTDITEIVTAICYRPDGQGVIVGSMTGHCRFYDSADNRLLPCDQVCLQSKKKSLSNRITGFQFCPSDPSKLMVSSADSSVRVLHGTDVICKFKGLRNSGSQIFASFTSDGMHVVSASEDSNVHVWNYANQDGLVSQPKSNWSCERFFSSNASIAIPWCGTTSCGTASTVLPVHRRNEERGTQQEESAESSQFRLSFSSPEQVSSSRGIFPEPLPRGSATWPEEKLPVPCSQVLSSAMCKSQYKFLKTCFQSTRGSPHAWGLVIVTAGWDGRIRSFQNYGLPVRV